MLVTGTALITGINGFVGSHLAGYLLEKGLRVCGMVRRNSSLEDIQGIAGRLYLLAADLTSARGVQEVVIRTKPDYIFHLASASSVFQSWQKPAVVMKTNVIGTVNLFEAVRKAGIQPVIQVAGSSEEYGMIYPDELPVKESNALRPLSPYAVSKVTQDKLSYQYFRSYGLKTVVTRAFNTTGPGRPPLYVTSNFARQVAEIEKGRKPVIQVGNLKAQRDFSDVRDVVRAYWLAGQHGEPGEVYNICSEKARTIQEVLDLLVSLSGRNIKIRQNPARMRPADIEVIRGDATKFRNRTGWQPEIPFVETMSDLLDYWRARV
ncbi:GDP-mannose 4,6-dehydratase [Chloroflexota bacterium]